MSLVVRVVDVVVLLRFFVLPGWLLTMLRVMSMRWAGQCVRFLLLPPAGGPVGGAGGVCSPAVLASLVTPSVGAP